MQNALTTTTLFVLVALALARHGQWKFHISLFSLRRPWAMSHSAALDQEVFYQLEQEARKMRGGVEECSSTVMLQHYYTSHCPFEWSCYPPDSPPVPTNWTLTPTARPPPTLPCPFPLSLSFITLSYPHCTLPHLSPWEPLWDWVLFLWPLWLLELDEPPPPRSSLMHSCTLSKHAGCLWMGHMTAVVSSFRIGQ